MYRAEDTTLRREVAVKVLHPHLAKRGDYRARFLREARAAAKLDHPGILRVFDVGEAGDEAFIVMELLRGRSIKEFLDERGAPLAEVAAMIGAVLADALAVAHRAGVIHRDVKPANVMAVDGGRLVLCDFGVARLVDDEALLTQSGMMVGTPAFMSPEQALGKDVDARSDVYSLGATLYQIATGQLPAAGSTPAVLSAVSRGEIVPALRRNPAIGADLAQVIARAMAKNPAERYPSAGAMRDALDAVAAAGGMGERGKELAEYFAEPGAWNEKHIDLVLARTLARARAAAAAKEYARALALADRVLALRPGDAEANSLVAAVGKGARGWRAARIGAALLAVAGLAVVAGVLWASRRGGSDPVSQVVEGAGVDAAGAEGPAPVAAVDAGVAVPIADAGRTERVRVPTRKAIDAGRAAPRIDAASAPIDAGAREEWGEIVVKVLPWCAIAIDGEPRGQSPGAGPIRVTAGKHTVTCEQSTTGLTFAREVEVKPGERRRIEGSLIQDVRVTLSVSTARLRIDGVVHANGTTIDVQPGRRRVELLAGDRVTADAYVSVKRACTIKDTPELACYE